MCSLFNDEAYQHHRTSHIAHRIRLLLLLCITINTSCFRVSNVIKVFISLCLPSYDNNNEHHERENIEINGRLRQLAVEKVRRINGKIIIITQENVSSHIICIYCILASHSSFVSSRKTRNQQLCGLQTVDNFGCHSTYECVGTSISFSFPFTYLCSIILLLFICRSSRSIFNCFAHIKGIWCENGNLSFFFIPSKIWGFFFCLLSAGTFA